MTYRVKITIVVKYQTMYVLSISIFTFDLDQF